MFAKTVLTHEERVVDAHLGYPTGYAKLCRHAYIHMQGLISPYTEGPPQRFQPYSPQDDEIAKLKGYDDLFPILDEEHRDTTNPKKYIESLWQQLDHLGNAGFDPAIFRVDTYGNVLYRDADPGSPLAWEVDYWYPHSRGGKTVPGNLRLVQWQASHRKGKRLEFLAPWWDLQLGVSVNQFLSVFASKNPNFRHRAFTFFFAAGENEQINDKKVVQSHSWPRQFRERKNQVGLAAAALVRVSRDYEGALRSLVTNKVAVAVMHEDDVRRDLQKFVSGNGKDMDEKKWIGSLEKENNESLVNKHSEEQSLNQLFENDMKYKMEASVQLEEELKKMKAHNVKEKAILDELEQALAKQKKQVEKQRRWSETQSQYRLCLEKMIRDTLHQCVVYKEQARLNQAACNSLLARLELQKSTCDEAEMELRRKMKQREELEVLARPKITKRVRHHGSTDVGSCLKSNVVVDLNPTRKPSSGVSLRDAPLLEDQQDDRPCHRSSRESKLPQPYLVQNPENGFTNACHRHLKSLEMHGHEQKSKEEVNEENEEDWPTEVTPGRMHMVKEAAGLHGSKRKALEVSGEMDVVLLGYEYQEDDNVPREESVGDNGVSQSSNCVCSEESDDGAEPDAESNNANQGGCDNSKFDVESNNANQGGCDYSNFGLITNKANQGFGRKKDAGEGAGREGAEVHKVLQQEGRDEELLLTLPTVAYPVVEDPKDREQVDKLLQEVLGMQDKVNEAVVEAVPDEEHDEDRVKRLGKLNLDRWLQKLLLDSGYGQDMTMEAGKQMEECVTAHNNDSEVAKGGVIGGLLKKLSFKNGGLLEDVADTNLLEPSIKGKPEKTKRSEERRISPWRWASPGSRRRSSSAGAESRPRALSPWRRTSKDDKAEERKMMESFSKLRVGGEKLCESNREARRQSMQWGAQAPQLQSVHHAQTPPPSRKMSVRRSTSTPALRKESMALVPIQDAKLGKTNSVSRSIVGGESRVIKYLANGGGSMRNNGVGGGENMEYIGGTGGGAARKANMLKKSASTRPAGANSEKGKQLANSAIRGRVGAAAAVKGAGNNGEEELEVEKGSLFEDLDAQDGLRASLSLAWKKAVKKFELGRYPPTPAHLEL